MAWKFFSVAVFLLLFPMVGRAAGPDVALTVTAFDVKENAVEVGFEAENRWNGALDVLYRLEFVSKDADSQGVTDVTDYKAIKIDPRSVARERFSYVVPSFVDKEQDIYLTTKTAAGFPLSGALVGTTSFKANPVPVTMKGCRLMDQEEGNSIVVASGVPVVLTCMLRNTADKEQTMFLSGDVSLWGASGDMIVSSTDAVLPPKKEVPVTLSFPPLEKPGNYEGHAYLGKDSVKLSSMTDFMIRVAGESGHIDRIELDKDSYVAGEKAGVTVYAVAIASSSTKRPMVAVDMQDGKGSSCAPTLRQSFVGGVEAIQVPIEKPCVDPQVKVTLSGGEGAALDQSTLAVMSGERPASEKWMGKPLALLLGGLALLLVLAGYLVVRMRKESFPKRSALMIAFFVLAGSFALAEPADASTFTGRVWWGGDYTAPAACDGSGAVCPERFRVVGNGSNISFYGYPSGIYWGAINISGSISITGSVTVQSETGSGGGYGSFRIVGNGNRLDFYGRGVLNGSLIVTGGTVSGGGDVFSTNAATVWATGTNSIMFTGTLSPVLSLTFTDSVPPVPVCVNGVGPYTAPQPYTNAWCQARGYDVVTNTCLGYCACTAPRTWDAALSRCVDPAPPVGVVNGICGPGMQPTGSECPTNFYPNGQNAPTPGSCSAGTSSASSGAAFWYPPEGRWVNGKNWTCLGSGGGTNASCGACESAPPAPVTTFTGSYAGPPAQTNVSNLWLPMGGGNVTLNWNDPLPLGFAGGGSCTASASPPVAGWNGAKPVTGTTTVTITEMTRFDLDCRNNSGTLAARKSVTVYVYSDAICPASRTMNVGDSPFQLRYWNRYDGAVIDCTNPSTPGASDLTDTLNTSWSIVPGTVPGPVATVTNSTTTLPSPYNHKGVVTAVNSGTATVSVAPNITRGIVASAPITVNGVVVPPPPPAPTYGICPNGMTLNLTTTTTGQLRLWKRTDGNSVDCANPSVSATDITTALTTSWGSSNSGVVAVENTTSKGRVSAVTAGSATISVTDNGASAGSVTVDVIGCLAYTCGTLPSSVTDQYCPDETFTTSNNCSGTITCTNGTRSCDFNWREVSPL